MIKFDKRFILTNYLIFFRYLRDKNILKQWKIIKNEFFIMTRIVKNVLVFISINISCERLFSIASRQYSQHKTYFSTIIRALMIIRHYDIKKNNFERFHEIWKTKNNEIAKEFKQNCEQQNENLNILKEHQYINDNNETRNEQTHTINTFFIISFELEINISINEKQKKSAFRSWFCFTKTK